MFLHLGDDIVIYTKDIIAILDLESILKSKISRCFLESYEKQGLIIKINDEEPRSFVLANDNTKGKNIMKKIEKTVIYYSPISTITLKKRANYINKITSIDF